MFKKLLHFLINKYTLTTLAFLVWLLFFDSNNIMNRLRVKERLNELKREKKHYLDEIRHDSILTQKLLNDSVEQEKFARERYIMKKDKEDVFLVIDTTVDPRQ